MEDVQFFKDSRIEGQMQALVLRLKVCPVCDSLTRCEADQCTLCNWAGKFEDDVNVVSDRLSALLGKCPELLHTLAPEAPQSFIARMKDFLFQEIRFRKRIDMTA